MKSLLTSVIAGCIFCLAGLFLFPVEVEAAECDGFTYEVHDGKATITGCTLEYNYYMDIPQTVDGYPVVSIGRQAFQDCTDLMGVTIPEGIETIEEFAFYQCYNLNWVYLPDSLISIGEKAFCNCKSLEIVAFGNGLKSIGYGAFSFCKKLDFYLDLPEGLEVIEGAAFYDCDSLVTVLLPNSLNTLGGKAFAMCGRLDYIYIPDGITNVGQDVLNQSACYYYSSNWYGEAFYIGSYLLEAKRTISGSYTTLKGITNIADGAFESCDDLTEIILPDSLRIIGANAFEYCDGIQSITIPEGVTTIGDEAFYECDALAEIHLPDTIQYWGKDVFKNSAFIKNPENWENNALYAGNYLIGCKSYLTGAFQPRQGTKIIVPGALKGLKGLTEVTLPDTVTTIGDEAFADCTALTKVTISDSVTAIGENAFHNCSALKTVHLGKSVEKIGSGAFRQCSSLENITLHSENPTYYAKNNCLVRTQDQTLILGCKSSRIPEDGSVTSIGAFAFEGCDGLTEITIPDAILTIGEGAFRDCNSLTTVNLGNGVQVVGKRAFEECDVLCNINLGQSVHTIEDHGFAYNHGITHVELPASLQHLGEEAFSNGTGLTSVTFREGLLTIGKNCFYFCENLKELHFPDSLEDIKDGAFYGCEKIETITFGNNLTYIGSSAFDGCKALVTLTIPESVQTIGSSAFYECASLRQVELGKVREIGYSAFEACKSLTQIHIPATVETMGKQVFAYCEAMEQMTVSPENVYYHSQDNCIINTENKQLAFGCKNSIIPTDGSVIAIDGYAFAGCTGLKEITVPAQIQRIAAYAFYNCSGLQEMQLPFLGADGSFGDDYLGYIFGAPPGMNAGFVPSSLKRVVILGGTTLGNSAFAGCYGLKEIVLPETMTDIYYSPFENCQSLETVVFPGEVRMVKDPNIFATTPYACLCISKGQTNTINFAQNNNIMHRIGGLITFLDENGQVIEKIWYPVNAAISTPEVPEKPADEYYTYEITWEPAPGTCDGNQTIQLRYVPHRIGGALPGDLNGDDEVNNLDVEYLLWHTLFPDSYPVAFTADFNKDGEVNNLDVAYLLWHTLFPETYPL